MPELHKNNDILFITTNINKYQEANKILSKHGIQIKKNDFNKIEIQNNDIEKIAISSAEEAFSILKTELIVEDSGLFIEKLNGFPGPYSSYAYKTIGIKGIIGILNKAKLRKASFKSVLAHANINGEIRTFTGITEGIISKSPKGNNGFAFDSIFIPNNSEITYGEMNIEEKNQYSHRAKSFDKFVLSISSKL
tara:strand:+ start:229 stop:807 length:579 start_codon:yes stop_codon:yes gene_type:complete